MKKEDKMHNTCISPLLSLINYKQLDPYLQ